MELGGFRFESPLWLLGVLIGPLIVWIAALREKHGRAITFPGVSRLRRSVLGWKSRWRRAPLLLAVAGLMLGFGALARPQRISVRRDVSTRGVDIVIALDVSGSMAAEDFRPRNRLSVAKDVVAEFVRRRATDRVGLVVFAGKSLTKCPPTTDQAVLLKQLDDVSLDMLPDGTAIGSGIATALTRRRHSKAASRVVVLVTDGGNNAGEIDPATATDLAKAMQVRVYTIGVGRQGKVPMPVTVQDSFTGKIYRKTVSMEVQYDAELLKAIASRSGGEFMSAADPEALRSIFARIDRLEKSEIRLSAYQRFHEMYPPLLIAAAVTIAFAGVLWMAGLREAPV
jgi:Ca-activated chloride channel family protein